MAETTMETPEHRLKRLHMRSWRRGMKEMDLILGHFADECLTALTGGELAAYEALLGENDQDLYLWVTARMGTGQGAAAGPQVLAPLLDRIAAHAETRFGTDR